jgi:hypothetical protein
MPQFTIQTPEGRRLTIDAPDEATALRGAKNWSLQQKSAPKKSGVLDQIGAFAQSAAEQIPFLDEAAAGGAALLTGKPYSQVRQVQRELAAEDRAERPLARNAGGVAGFGATLAAPGGGYIKGAKTIGGAALRSAQVGAAYGGLAGAGGADGDLGERAAAGLTGAAVGAATGGALPYAGKAISGALRKAPTMMSVDELAKAKKAAYQAPALSGVTYTPQARTDLARSLQNEMVKARMNPKRHPAPASVLSDIVGDLKGKNPIGLQELDQLRQIAWRDAAGLKDPNRASEAMMGHRLVDVLDDFMDSADASHVLTGDPVAASAAMKEARSLNKRWRKALTVTNELDSADLRKSAAYSGSNTDNTIRQRMRTLVDPTSGKRIRNATPDEDEALRRVVDGGFVQNRAREIGGMFDPRRLGGKILAPMTGLSGAAAAPATGGASLLVPAAQLVTGLGATTVANRASQKNVKNLVALIAAGGSKQALKKAPTRASAIARKGVRSAARAPGIAGILAEALAQGGL